MKHNRIDLFYSPENINGLSLQNSSCSAFTDVFFLILKQIEIFFGHTHVRLPDY